MGITVRHNHFQSDAEAEKEIATAGLYCAHQSYEASQGTPIHWHPIDIHGYIKAGNFRFQDPSTGEKHDCGPGSYFRIPPRTLHIEEEHDGYDIILGLSVAFENIPEPAIRPPEELES